MTIINKYLITSILLLIISLILVILIFIKRVNREIEIEQFDDFKKHQQVLNQLIKEKTNSANLANIPILNGVNPNDEIERKSSSFTKVNDESDLSIEKPSVNLKKVNEREKNNNNNQNKPKKNIIINKSIAENSCKYISSYSSTPDCPANYNIYSGASMGISDGQLSCNGQMVSNQRARST